MQRVKNRIYVPIKVSETKGNKSKYNYCINTHGNIRIYASMATLKRYMKESEYDSVIVFHKMVQLNKLF